MVIKIYWGCNSKLGPCQEALKGIFSSKGLIWEEENREMVGNYAIILAETDLFISLGNRKRLPLLLVLDQSFNRHSCGFRGLGDNILFEFKR